MSLQNYIKQLEQEYEDASKGNNFALKTRVHELQPLIQILQERKAIVDNITNLQDLLNEKDDDIKKLAEEEKVTFEKTLATVDEKLLDAVLPPDKDDECRSMVLEVNAGVGGQEAMLFASELFEMYSTFAEHQGI